MKLWASLLLSPGLKKVKFSIRNSSGIKVAVRIIATSILLFSTVSAHAQECPQRSATGATVASASLTIEGSLIYHDGIRQWFELRLNQPQCGQSSIQLVALKDTWTALEVLRGCRVKSTGPIDFSGTGYYSLDTWQNVNGSSRWDLARGSCRFPITQRKDRTILSKSTASICTSSMCPGIIRSCFELRAQARNYTRGRLMQVIY